LNEGPVPCPYRFLSLSCPALPLYSLLHTLHHSQVRQRS
jgi:hypothetical protein